MRFRFWILFIAVFIAGIFYLQSIAPVAGYALSKENGFVENSQVMVLFLSSIAFMVPVARTKGIIRYALLSGVLLCFSFILRELDVECLDVPRWVVVIGSGVGRNVLLGIGWVVMGCYFIRSISELREWIKPVLLSKITYLLIISACVLLLGAVFDHKDNKVASDQLVEELFELLGYGLFLIASLKICAKSCSLKRLDTPPFQP